jgi:hypothetical protein
LIRLREFASGALEVFNAIAVRLEDVIGEWVDTRQPHPKRAISIDARERIVADAGPSRTRGRWLLRRGMGGANESRRALLELPSPRSPSALVSVLPVWRAGKAGRGGRCGLR